ncbi:HEAT repeat domain-containing protein [Clostridium sp. YIM B02551]|uniref:HEAT repeat domain-containing protein n=1 Tax=Clostridium sp. YIM B02551 TaxID=2910679 RepID=UPI001EEC373A|nr:HEAT repeat domain-containing protein [Clostridium sp. YIM B02551]
MERLVYYSIVFFIGFILILYIYLVYQKILEKYIHKKSKSYYKDIVDFFDEFMINLEKREGTIEEIQKLSKLVKNKIKRRIIIDRIAFYSNIYTGIISKRMSEVCYNIGLLEYEFKNLKSRDYFKVAHSCKNLGIFKNEAATEHLLKVLRIRSIDIRYNVLMALTKIGDKEALIEAFNILGNKFNLSERALTEIIDSFEGDKLGLFNKMLDFPNVFVSTVFIKTTGGYMVPTLNENIARFINNENKEKRIAAIKAIGKTGDTRFMDQILNKLKDRNWEVRSAAAKALGAMRDERALDALINALSDSEWWVRYNSANSIISIKAGINKLRDIFMSDDEFAKDSIVSALEGSGLTQDIFVFQYSREPNKKELYDLFSDYLSMKES